MTESALGERRRRQAVAVRREDLQGLALPGAQPRQIGVLRTGAARRDEAIDDVPARSVRRATRKVLNASTRAVSACGGTAADRAAPGPAR